eukprot:8617580-Pyramimonas_sp.AAC.1
MSEGKVSRYEYVPESCEEASSLQGDVAGANAQGLSGGLGERENIIGCDAALLVTLDTRVRRASTDRDDHLVRSDLGGLVE